MEFTIASFSEFWIHSGLSLLPVNLTSFTADKKLTGVLLNWTTGNEINADHFIIERSSDGYSYSPIASMPATGNTTAATNYSYTDTDPSKGQNYYRLQQVDKDGKKTTSKILMLDWAAANNITVSLSYQSAKQLRAAIDGKVTNGKFVVFDAGGRALKQYTVNTQAAGSAISINLDAYSAGIYLYQLVTGKGITCTGKIVIK